MVNIFIYLFKHQFWFNFFILSCDKIFTVCGARYKTRQGLSYHVSHTHRPGGPTSSRGGGNSRGADRNNSANASANGNHGNPPGMHPGLPVGMLGGGVPTGSSGGGIIGGTGSGIVMDPTANDNLLGGPPPQIPTASAPSESTPSPYPPQPPYPSQPDALTGLAEFQDSYMGYLATTQAHSPSSGGNYMIFSFKFHLNIFYYMINLQLL